MTDVGQHKPPGQPLDIVDGLNTDDLPPMTELPAPPGSTFLAEKMERRKFIRRASTSLFMGFVAVSSGTASLMGFLASPAQAAGACCPYCCGPSPCCNTSCCRKGCCSPVGQDFSCSNNQVTCFGYANTWSGDACWTCISGGNHTICCDCRTNSQTNCPHPSGINRCICWYSGPGLAPQGVKVIRDASQVPAWN
jgi:hypothetical protein